MNISSFRQQGPARQRGVVLAVGLILLLVMTLLMVVAMSGSILQERMAGAIRNESIADAGADSALRDGEVWVWNQIVATGGQLTISNSAYPLRPDAPSARAYREGGSTWVAGGSQYGTGGAGINFTNSDYYSMAKAPAYLVEGLGEITGEPCVESHCGSGNTLNESLHYYRITGRSTGGTESVARAVESTFSISVFEN